VVGEAKRGKSTVINALIGQPILPTDVDIATSQVFLVEKAAQPAFRLRFEDGSAEEIRAADLPKYGSQVLADVAGTPRLDQIIRWIEVAVPARFLPDGISLLDTPGLGSLYAAHSQITQRFIPHADAVIYVLDSGQPIGQADLDTIAAILEVTENLFFIQTRIDESRKEQWQALQARNEQVLRERFAGKLGAARVWPISSTNLQKAAETGDADYELVSRHRELGAALKAFLFRVAGLSRVTAALLVAGHYHGTARQVLAAREASLAEDCNARNQEVQQDLARRRQEFDGEWGERGTGRQALVAEVQRLAEGGRQTLMQSLGAGGQIDTAIRARIDAVQSIEDANHLAGTIAEEVTQAAVRKWQEVDEGVRRHVMELLRPFVEALESLASSSYAARAEVGGGYQLETRDDWFEKAKGARIDFMTATGMIGLGGGAAWTGLVIAGSSSTLVATFLASAAFPPLALGAALAAGVWACVQGFKGWWRAGETQLKKARQELYKYSTQVREEVRRYYFGVDSGAGRFESLADAHFKQFINGVKEELQRQAQRQSEESRHEWQRLQEQARLDEQQRAARLTEVRGQFVQWNQMAQGFQEVVRETAIIERTLEALSQAPAAEQPE
jgi:GTP-binding protein EngB required for normal cell division